MKRNAKILLMIFAILMVFVLLVRIVNLNRNHTQPEDNQLPPSDGNNNNGDNQGDNTTYINTPIFNIRYGTAPLEIFDFYPPFGDENSDTLVVFVHGGAWVAGDKNYFTSSAVFFALKGYSVVNMDYRLAPTWTYPAQLNDITSVLNYVNLRREEFKLNPNYKIVLVGHSAGGHLVDLYGVRENDYGGVNVNEVVSLAGPTDLVSYYQSEENIDPFLDAFLGNTSKEEASPSKNVPQGENTKYLLILGGADPLVPQNQVTIFENALKEKGAYVETLIVPGRDHNSIYNQIPQNDRVAQKILEFIQ